MNRPTEMSAWVFDQGSVTSLLTISRRRRELLPYIGRAGQTPAPTVTTTHGPPRTTMSAQAAAHTMGRIRNAAADRIADERAKIAAWGVVTR
jgi:hypothetical protein